MSTTLSPTDLDQTSNPLRPRSFAEMVGQDALKPLLSRLVASARATGEPLDHILLVGASGTGKTTTATVIAHELGRRVFCLKAPLDTGMLDELRTNAQDGDVVFVDEIHLQVSGDRRGMTQACDPESFYQLLEDGVLATKSGLVTFPAVTWIGATTDVGLLPEALANRFPLQPRLAPYTVNDMAIVARHSLACMGLQTTDDVPMILARACRSNPRQLNSYVRSARSLAGGQVVDATIAREVVEDLNGTTLDGLTESMQTMLRYLYRSCKRMNAAGDVAYRSSVGAIATACGHGRDQKAIALLVEPYLIQRGYVSVTPQGRELTAAGIERARELAEGLAAPQMAAEPVLAVSDGINHLMDYTAKLIADLRAVR